MDYELLLSGTKWDIVSSLAKQPKSPMELAKELRTSTANISMQIRLLEVAQLVAKKRIPNAKAGEPRLSYYLTQNLLFVHGASPQVQMRQAISLNSEKEIILNIWKTPASVQSVLTKFYYANTTAFSESLFFSEVNKNTITLLTTKPSATFTQEHNGTKYTIECKHTSDFSKHQSALALHRGVK